MRLSSTGLEYDAEGVLPSHRHSRKTYQQLMADQIHQASALVTEKAAMAQTLGQLPGGGGIDAQRVLRGAQQFLDQPLNMASSGGRSSKLSKSVTPQNFVNGQQSGTFISLKNQVTSQNRVGHGQPNVLPGAGYEFGFGQGVEGGRPRLDLAGKMLMTQSGFLGDTASDRLSQSLLGHTHSAFGGPLKSSGQFRATGFSTMGSRMASPVARPDASQLIIADGVDPARARKLVLDKERAKRPRPTFAADMSNQSNVLVELKLKHNYLKREKKESKASGLFATRRASQAVKASAAQALLDEAELASIPKGSPRAAKVAADLDSPERSNNLSTVIHYAGDGRKTTLPPLKANASNLSQSLAQKQRKRDITHSFNIDYGRHDAEKYYRLQKESKAKFEQEFVAIVKDGQMPRLALQQIAQKTVDFSKLDEDFVYRGRSEAFGQGVNKSKLRRETVFPKTPKTLVSLNSIFKQRRRTEQAEATDRHKQNAEQIQRRFEA